MTNHNVPRKLAANCIHVAVNAKKNAVRHSRLKIAASNDISRSDRAPFAQSEAKRLHYLPKPSAEALNIDMGRPQIISVPRSTSV